MIYTYKCCFDYLSNINLIFTLSVKCLVHSKCTQVTISKSKFTASELNCWFLKLFNRFMKKIRLKRTIVSRISACYLTAMVWQVSARLIPYLIEDPEQLKQVARIQRSHLQHTSPNRRPLRADGQALVPAGVWAESPAGLYTLILSYQKRPWVGSRGLGRAPPGSTPGIQPGRRLHTLPLRQRPLTVAQKRT